MKTKFNNILFIIFFILILIIFYLNYKLSLYNNRLILDQFRIYRNTLAEQIDTLSIQIKNTQKQIIYLEDKKVNMFITVKDNKYNIDSTNVKIQQLEIQLQDLEQQLIKWDKYIQMKEKEF